MNKISKLLAVLSVSIILTGCNGGGEETPEPVPQHEHTYSSEWTTNSEMHWHESSCEHTGLTKDLGEHTFNADGKCSVCEMDVPNNYRKVSFDGDHLSLDALMYYKQYERVEFELKVMEGYRLPKTITCSGISDFSYDNETGKISGVVVDNVEISAKAIPISANYYISKSTYSYKKSEEDVIETKEYYFDEKERKLTYLFCETLIYHDRPSSYRNRVTYLYDENYNLVSELKEIMSPIDEDYNFYYRNYYTYENDLLTVCRYSYDDVSYGKTTYTYDEFNRLVSKWDYGSENDELPRYRYEYTYLADRYEYIYYYDYDQFGRQESFYEEIDEENKTKTISQYYGTREEGSAGPVHIYDLESNRTIGVENLSVYLHETIDENHNPTSNTCYVGYDRTKLKYKKRHTYFRNFLITIDVFNFDEETGDVSTREKEKYSYNEDGYVSKIEVYDVTNFEEELLSKKEFETAPLDGKIKFPNELRLAYCDGNYPSDCDEFEN